jgi:nucleotide-binding universal stress UspA family protein
VAESLEALAVFGDVVDGRPNPEEAVRWLAAAAALREENEVPVSPLWEPGVEERLGELRGEVGERFGRVWEEGRRRAQTVVLRVIGGRGGSQGWN